MNDPVNGPAHYNGTELIDDMARRHGAEKVRAFCELNAEKYRFRAGKKAGNTAEQDEAKAKWYEAYAANLPAA